MCRKESGKSAQELREEDKDRGSDCGSVGRAVVSNTRGRQFRYWFLATFLEQKFTLNC